MGEPGRTSAATDWWKSLSTAWRANVGLYCLATVALVALLAQIAVGRGQPAQRVEVASRARTTPTSPRMATTTTVGPTTTAVGQAPTSAPDTTVPPGPVRPNTPGPPAPLSVGPSPPPQDTTTAPPLICRNSTDPACGPLFWNPLPSPNQPLSVNANASPSSLGVGEVVTFTVQVVDPDHPVTDNCAQIDYGDGVAPSLPCTRPQCPDAHGPWSPPAAVDGNQTFTYAHQYSSVGSYRATFSFHTDDDPPCPDPYGSANSGQAVVTVGS